MRTKLMIPVRLWLASRRNRITMLQRLKRKRWFVKCSIKGRIKVIALRHNRFKRKKLPLDWQEPFKFKQYWSD